MSRSRPQVLGILAAATRAPLVRASGLLVVSAILCALAWAVRWRVRRGSSRGGPSAAAERAADAATAGASRPSRRRAVQIVVATAVVGFLACAAASGLSAPPRGWDVLSYHLPRTASWLLHGDLGPYGSVGAFYPGNAELPILSLLFAGSDRLVPLVQVPFALLAALALYGLARALGATSRSAALAVLALLLSPIVFFHATIAKDDLVVAALVLSGSLFLVRSLRDGLASKTRLREVGAAGFALGLALGTKYSILPYVVGSMPLVLLVHYLRYREDRFGAVRPGALTGGRSAGARRAVFVFVVAVAVPSVFWFARNIAVAGNPVEPVPLGLREWAMWEGLGPHLQLQFIPRPGLWWFFPWIDRQLVAGYNGSAGYGAAFGAFFAPGLALCVQRVLARRRAPRFRLERIAILLSIALGAAAWWFGKHHLPRLLLPILALACAPVALVFDAVTERVRTILSALLAAALLFSAAETLRVVFQGRDITWAHQGGVDRREFYRMPDLIYELPVGTRILLLKPSADDLYRTYRYPLAGNVPGNDVVMEDDVGIEIALDKRGAVLGHLDLHRRGIEYVFMRVQSFRRHTTWFDAYPSLYEKVVDTAEPGYRWYREAYAVDEAGEVLGRALVITKMYRVLPRPPGLDEAAAGGS